MTDVILLVYCFVMSSIPFYKLKKVKVLYYKKLLSMREIAEEFKVSTDAVVYPAPSRIPRQLAAGMNA